MMGDGRKNYISVLLRCLANVLDCLEKLCLLAKPLRSHKCYVDLKGNEKFASECKDFECKQKFLAGTQTFCKKTQFLARMQFFLGENTKFLAGMQILFEKTVSCGNANIL